MCCCMIFSVRVCGFCSEAPLAKLDNVAVSFGEGLASRLGVPVLNKRYQDPC